MAKKLVCLLMLLCSCFVIPVFVYSADETFTVSTYYPSPKGVYKELRLYPTASSSDCNSDNEGKMYYNATSHSMNVCSYNGTSYVYAPMSNSTGVASGDGFWSKVLIGGTGDDIFNNNTGQVIIRNLANITRAYVAQNLGVGVLNPQDIVHVQGGQHTIQRIVAQNGAAGLRVGTLDKNRGYYFGQDWTSENFVVFREAPLRTGGWYDLTLTPAGDLGVGLAAPESPANRLHVRYTDNGSAANSIIETLKVEHNTPTSGMLQSGLGTAIVFSASNSSGYGGVLGSIKARWVASTPAVPEFIFNLGSYGDILVLSDPGLALLHGNAIKPGGGPWSAPSDARLKDITEEYKYGLEQILKIKPIKYHYKKNNPYKFDSNKEYIGITAQDIKKIFPEAVTTDEKGYLFTDSSSINWAMINAVKELKRDNDALRQELQEIKAELRKMKK